MLKKLDRVESETGLDSRPMEPMSDPANWEPAELIPTQSITWIKIGSLDGKRGAASSRQKSQKNSASPSLRTAASALPSKPSYSTAKNSTRSSVQKSTMASTQKTMAASQSTQQPASIKTSMASTPRSVNPLLDGEFGLKLSKESMDVIKTDIYGRSGGQEPPDEVVSAMTTLEVYSSHLETRLRECGQCLDQLIGERFVLISEARKAMEQIVSMGIITMEEVIMSPDCEKLTVAANNDVITIHSLSSIVRIILNSRHVG